MIHGLTLPVHFSYHTSTHTDDSVPAQHGIIGLKFSNMYQYQFDTIASIITVSSFCKHCTLRKDASIAPSWFCFNNNRNFMRFVHNHIWGPTLSFLKWNLSIMFRLLMILLGSHCSFLSYTQISSFDIIYHFIQTMENLLGHSIEHGLGLNTKDFPSLYSSIGILHQYTVYLYTQIFTKWYCLKGSILFTFEMSAICFYYCLCSSLIVYISWLCIKL